jgi:hypothetical protein
MVFRPAHNIFLSWRLRLKSNNLCGKVILRVIKFKILTWFHHFKWLNKGRILDFSIGDSDSAQDRQWFCLQMISVIKESILPFSNSKSSPNNFCQLKSFLGARRLSANTICTSGLVANCREMNDLKTLIYTNHQNNEEWTIFILLYE